MTSPSDRSPRGRTVGAAAVVLLASSALLTGPAPAQETEEPRPRTIRVEEGDTLWELARRHLGAAHRWQALYRANAGRLASPNRLRPGMRLVLPGVPEAAARAGDRAGADRHPAEAGDRTAPPGQAVPRPRPAESLFSREERALAGALHLDTTAPPARVTRWAFARAPFLADPTDGVEPARTLNRVDWSATPTELSMSVGADDRVRLAPGQAPLRPGDRLQAFHWGARVAPGRTIARPVALLRVEAVTEDGVVARVIGQYGLYRVGDPVVPLPEPPDLRGGRMVRVSGRLAARLLGPSLERPLVRPGSVLFLDAGREDGVRPADEFVAPAEGPGADAVLLRVIRADAGTATVRVVSLRDPHLRTGVEARLVRRLVFDEED